MGDADFALVPIEALDPSGIDRAFAARLAERRGWSVRRIEFFDAAFSRYWQRSADLSRRAAPWPGPRVRHVVVVTDAARVRPYAQILNATSWTLYDSDLDPERSHVELTAWLLASGDWMTRTGEVSLVPLRAAAWWLERSDSEYRDFVAAAAASTRPDASLLRAVGEAVPWLRRLHHAALRPAPTGGTFRAVPGTGLLVPREIESEPVRLSKRCRIAAEETIAVHHAHWRAAPTREIERLCSWLATDVPSVLVVGKDEHVLWDPERPDTCERVASALTSANAIAVASIESDLRVVDRHTRRFFEDIVDPGALPPPPYQLERGGYSYLHPDRGRIAYALYEPGMERLVGPPLPYARAMLGARTAHEWGHLADSAGWVVLGVPRSEFEAAVAELVRELDASVARLPTALRDVAKAEWTGGPRPGSVGEALAKILLARLPDWRANLFARRFMDFAERETYARHNVRSLGPPEAGPHPLRRLVRYLYEMQYVEAEIGLSAVPDGRDFFVRSTGFGDEFLVRGVLSEDRFHALADATHRVLSCLAVDESRFRKPSGTQPDEPMATQP